jgi:hypothetical protein
MLILQFNLKVCFKQHPFINAIYESFHVKSTQVRKCLFPVLIWREMPRITFPSPAQFQVVDLLVLPESVQNLQWWQHWTLLVENEDFAVWKWGTIESNCCTPKKFHQDWDRFYHLKRRQVFARQHQCSSYQNYMFQTCLNVLKFCTTINSCQIYPELQNPATGRWLFCNDPTVMRSHLYFAHVILTPITAEPT